MKFDEQLDIYLRARFTLLVLITAEEERAIQSIKTLCERTQRACPLSCTHDPLSCKMAP